MVNDKEEKTKKELSALLDTIYVIGGKMENAYHICDMQRAPAPFS
jgi:hypothetical protein